MTEIKSHGKLFFDKNHAGWPLTPSPIGHTGRRKSSIVLEIIRPKPRRGREHVPAARENAISMVWHEVLIGGDDRNSPGTQTKNQSPVWGDTDDATAHRSPLAT
jgi:hypothetical protein